MFKSGLLRKKKNQGLMLSLLLISAIWGAPVSVQASSHKIEVTAASVALNPQDLLQQSLGAFVYAGGLVLSSDQTEHLHGLSDLELIGQNQLIAVGDRGHLFKAQLQLDEKGRLIGLIDAQIAPLTGIDGQVLVNKEDADAEGLALLPNGDMLISFERKHRVLSYPAHQTGLPMSLPVPDHAFVQNTGLEALATDLHAGPEDYLVGAEGSGQTWRCGVKSACEADYRVPMPAGFSLVSMKRLPEGLTAYLLRAWDKEQGNRIILMINQGEKPIARLEMARPLTIDNFEGVAAVRLKNGAYRFYLLSDDNYNAQQRTLLLAFDWQP